MYAAGWVLTVHMCSVIECCELLSQVKVINPLQPIVPKVDLLLCDGKSDFRNHFETAIFLSLYLLHAF